MIFNEKKQSILGVPQGEDALAAVVFSSIFIVIFVTFYGGASWLVGMIPWRFEVALPFETLIPFWPEAAIVYLSLNVLLCLTPFILRTWRELFPLFACLVAETVVASIFFIIFPISTTFPERNAEGLIEFFFNFADKVNLDGNFFPSLHVAFAFTTVFAVAAKLSYAARIGMLFWVIAISISTILMHEHQVLDVMAGFMLAAILWNDVGNRCKQVEVLTAVEVEMICVRNFIAFGKRHPRYWLIAFYLFLDSLPKWRKRRVFRTGFCFLQYVDDLLDGDRKSFREPIEVVDEVICSIESGKYKDGDLMTLANAFVSDIRSIGGELAVNKTIELIKVMRRDRTRVLNQQLLSKDDLRAHHHKTFSLSIDLMLIARNADLRAMDVPELVDLLGWCSTVRDFRDDLSAGLVNVPIEVINKAHSNGITLLDYEFLLSTKAVRDWLCQEHLATNNLIDLSKYRLQTLKGRKGEYVLRIFLNSISGFSQKKFKRIYPKLSVSSY